MEFQLMFLSLTHTRSFAYILLAGSHVCTAQTLAYTHTSVHARTCSHAYKGFA